MARSVGLFAAWALAGAGLVLGFVSLGPLVLVPAVVLLVLLGSSGFGAAAAGLPAGCGAVFLFIAYVQRDGPGWHCTEPPDSVECGESADPRPWLAIGLALVVVSVVLAAIGHRRRSSRSAERRRARS